MPDGRALPIRISPPLAVRLPPTVTDRPASSTMAPSGATAMSVPAPSSTCPKTGLAERSVRKDAARRSAGSTTAETRSPIRTPEGCCTMVAFASQVKGATSRRVPSAIRRPSWPFTENRENPPDWKKPESRPSVPAGTTGDPISTREVERDRLPPDPNPKPCNCPPSRSVDCCLTLSPSPILPEESSIAPATPVRRVPCAG